MESIRRFDRAWARAEGALTVGVLILMVLVAAFQAFVRNLSRWDVHWAAEMLFDMEWADSLLRKGTLWLAFLGASLATHYSKHIGIDVVVRIAPLRAKFVMRMIACLAAGVITLALTYCFWSAALLNLTERPLQFEVLGDEGSMHVCDATDEQVAELDGLEKPTIFCVARSLLAVLSVPAETPGAAFQLIVPLMFFVIAVRLIAKGTAALITLSGGEVAMQAAQAEENRQVAERARQVAGTWEDSIPPAPRECVEDEESEPASDGESSEPPPQADEGEDKP